MIDDDQDARRRLWLVFAAAFVLTLTALVVDAHAQVAPDPPEGYKAPLELVAKAVKCSCRSDADCIAKRGPEVAETVRLLAWVGSWYTHKFELPAFAAWWLPAQMCRESGGHLAIRGDRGLSVGALQLKKSPWVKWWRKHTGRRLDRTDPLESARVLMLAVVRSYMKKVHYWCGPQKSQFRRFRLAAARVGRGPFRRSVHGYREDRCDYWVNTKDGWKEIAGITAVWARLWFDGRSK